MDQFTNNGYLEKNLEALHRIRIQEQNKDLTGLVCGAPGNGKSALTWLCGEYIASNVDDVQFDWESVAFTHNQWIDNEREKLPKKAVSWYDEGYNTFQRRNAMTKENKQGQSHLNQYRFKHHTRFINFQDIANMEPDLLFSDELGVEYVLRCVKQGWVWFLSQKSVRKINIVKDKNGMKQVKWPKPDFRFSFPDPAELFPEKWDEYETVNEEKVKEDEKKENSQRTVTCEQCDYSWVPRTDVPKQCPDCGTRHWNRRVG